LNARVHVIKLLAERDEGNAVAILEKAKDLATQHQPMATPPKEPTVTEPVQMLLEKGAKKNPKKLQTALAHAKDNEAITTPLQAHIVHEPDPALAYDQLRNAIHANRTNTEYLTRLFHEVVVPDAGLNSRHPDTPFYWAAAMGLIDEVKKRFPAEHTKDRNEELRAAYDIAYQFGRIDVLNYLTPDFSAGTKFLNEVKDYTHPTSNCEVAS
jgi:hypothetical protein